MAGVPEVKSRVREYIEQEHHSVKSCRFVRIEIEGDFAFVSVSARPTGFLSAARNYVFAIYLPEGKVIGEEQFDSGGWSYIKDNMQERIDTWLNEDEQELRNSV